MSKLYGILLLLFSWFFMSPALAQTPASDRVDIGSVSSIEISNRVDIFLDPSAKVSVAEVTAQDFQGFKRNEELYPSFGAFPGRVWVRMLLSNDRAETAKYVIGLNAVALDARLYTDGQEMKAGRIYGSDQEQYPSRMPSFLVEFKPQEQKTLYLSIRADMVYSLKLKVSQPEVFYQAERFGNYFAGFYVGIMLIMILYNCFLFAATRDISFLWYVLTVFFLHLNVIGLYMTNSDYFGIRNPIFPEKFGLIAKILGTIFLIQFSRVFLRTSQAPKLDWFLKGVMAVSPIFFALLFVLPLARANAFHNLILMPSLISMIVYSGILFSRGLRYARFYFIAWFPVLLVGLVTVMLNMLKLGNLFHNSGILLMIASIIEVLLLSMALGDKINEMRAEKEKEEAAHKAEVLEMNRSLEQKVKEKTQDIRSMLDNLKMGIFTVNRQLQIGEDYSQHLNEIVGNENLKNLAVMSILFKNSELGADTLSQVESALYSILGFDELGYIANEDYLVKQFSRKTNGSPRDLELDWSPITSENGIIEKVLVSVKDVTELNSLRRESEIQRRRVEIIEQCLTISWEKFEPLKDEMERILATANGRSLWIRDAGQPESAETVVAGLFAAMHTQKALTRKHRLTYLSDAIHEAENYLHKVRDGQDTLTKEKMTASMTEVASSLDLYIHTFELLRGEAGHNHKPTEHRIEQLIMEGLSDRESIAREVGKPAPAVQVSIDQNINLSSSWAKAVETMMVQLLRNSLDHGLEKPSERQAKGKAPGGLISIRLKTTHTGHALEYSDDGVGLNLAKVKTKGLEKGLISATKDYSDQEIAELIFSSGLSTKDEVSALSGRGVGLDAVAMSIRNLGGQIHVRPSPLTFVIEIPGAELRKAQV
ncbi:MAG TPA: 7TM diverse intracellular signaling domain-containing protein [Oligoflexus sp.]|uniref:7TM diverse intracellular signaling domain-containing protein n=1 Tax=Oligoflexus sp. TaxID=1971216 RepID=UPI002D6EBC3C|nr:7TM diverse intracellular signaling domain-containing protein [Oligoflexus sp.]HYX37677.1 7TM diverse intracellular signaling domain-containing protein [Oligoflexus sp.]